MVGMGGSPTRNHADEIARRNGVGGRAAQAFPFVFSLYAALGQRQAAGSHAAVFTANALGSDIAGLHVDRPIKYRFNTFLLGNPDHFLGCEIDGGLFGICQFRGLGLAGVFFFFHYILLIWIV